MTDEQRLAVYFGMMPETSKIVREGASWRIVGMTLEGFGPMPRIGNRAGIGRRHRRIHDDRTIQTRICKRWGSVAENGTIRPVENWGCVATARYADDL